MKKRRVVGTVLVAIIVLGVQATLAHSPSEEHRDGTNKILEELQVMLADSAPWFEEMANAFMDSLEGRLVKETV